MVTSAEPGAARARGAAAETDDATGVSGWKTARRIIGGLLLLSALGAAFLFSYDGIFRLCEKTTGTDPAVMCKAPGVDLLVLLFLPGVAFFIPDVSELSIFGIGVKREVEEARQEAADAKKTAGAAFNVIIRSGMENDPAFHETSLSVVPDRGGRIAGAPDEPDGVESGPLEEPAPSRAARPPRNRPWSASAEGDVLSSWWEQLEPAVALARALQRPEADQVRAALRADQDARLSLAGAPALARVPRPLSDETMDAVVRWHRTHSAGLTAVGSAATYDVPLSDADVEALVAGARRLWETLPKELRQLTA